jgi:hypothetical protein
MTNGSGTATCVQQFDRPQLDYKRTGVVSAHP